MDRKTLFMPLSFIGEGKQYMAELRETHLRYLLAVYELWKSGPEVGIQAVAETLSCSKASVTKMMGNLMELGLLVREKYGKIYLTDTGFLLAKEREKPSCTASFPVWWSLSLPY